MPWQVIAGGAICVLAAGAAVVGNSSHMLSGAPAQWLLWTAIGDFALSPVSWVGVVLLGVGLSRLGPARTDRASASAPVSLPVRKRPNPWVYIFAGLISWLPMTALAGSMFGEYSSSLHGFVLGASVVPVAYVSVPMGLGVVLAVVSVFLVRSRGYRRYLQTTGQPEAINVAHKGPWKYLATFVLTWFAAGLGLGASLRVVGLSSAGSGYFAILLSAIATGLLAYLDRSSAWQHQPIHAASVAAIRVRGCASCGADLLEGAKYCDLCGQAAIPRCAECDTELAERSRFCSACGKGVSLEG